MKSTAKSFQTIIINNVPSGAIMMWRGKSIPNGWVQYDGTYNTPGLRNMLIVGAASQYIPNDKREAKEGKPYLDNLPSNSHIISHLYSMTDYGKTHYNID